MSVDFSWERLDEALAKHLVEALNRHLQTVTRPSFIGPVEVTAFEFGSASPDVEIVDMRDIYRDFLEDDEDDDVAPSASEKQHPGEGSSTSTQRVWYYYDGHISKRKPQQRRASRSRRRGTMRRYEWVSRRSTRKAMAQEAPAYHHLPPHMRYGRPPSGDFLASLPGMHTPRDIWSNTGVGGPGGGLSGFGSGGVWGGGSGGYAAPAAGMSLSVPKLHMRGGGAEERRPGAVSPARRRCGHRGRARRPLPCMPLPRGLPPPPSRTHVPARRPPRRSTRQRIAPLPPHLHPHPTHTRTSSCTSTSCSTRTSGYR